MKRGDGTRAAGAVELPAEVLAGIHEGVRRGAWVFLVVPLLLDKRGLGGIDVWLSPGVHGVCVVKECG